jgi:cell wall-associated NlpC family hydrolase
MPRNQHLKMWLADHIFIRDASLSSVEGDPRFTLVSNLRRDTPALYRVRETLARLYADPELYSANITQILYGEPFEVHYSDELFAYGRSLCDGYVGWVLLSDLTSNWQVPSHLVSAPLAPLYQNPHLKQTSSMLLPMGAMVTTTGTTKNGYIELECGRWLFAKHVTEKPINDRSLLDIAKLFIGLPYVWGGRTAMGIDCSGLLQTSMTLKGLRYHRDSDMQFKTLGTNVECLDLQAGDIAFFPGHVGIMVDEINILHANATHMAVTIDPLDDVISWVARDTDGAPFLGGKRLAVSQ